MENKETLQQFNLIRWLLHYSGQPVIYQMYSLAEDSISTCFVVFVCFHKASSHSKIFTQSAIINKVHVEQLSSEVQLSHSKNIVVITPLVVFFRYVCNDTYWIPFPFNTKNGKEQSSHDPWHFVVSSIDIMILNCRANASCRI